jgi:hypothetical protein
MIKSAISGFIAGLTWAFIISVVKNFSSEFSEDGQSTINWESVVLLSAIFGAVIGVAYVIVKEFCRVCGVAVDFDGVFSFPKKTINEVAFALGAISGGFVVGSIERLSHHPERLPI